MASKCLLSVLMDGTREVSVPDAVCGIYFLLDGADVVYIGRSKNVAARVAHHWQGGYGRRKKFTEARVLECDPDMAGELEQRVITIWRPKYNCAGLPKTERTHSCYTG